MRVKIVKERVINHRQFRGPEAQRTAPANTRAPPRIPPKGKEEITK